MLVHKMIFGLLLLTMALVFFVQLVFSGVILSYNQNRFAHTEWGKRLFYSSNHALDSGQVEIVLNELFPLRNQILDVYICGLIPEEYYKTHERISGLSPALSIVAFYPNISSDRLTDGGDMHFFDDRDTIYLDGLLSGFVIYPEESSPDSSEVAITSDGQEGNPGIPGATYRINGKLWRSKGSIDFKHSVSADTEAYIISSYDQFFELTDLCTRISIQFCQPLNDSDLMRLNQRMLQAGVYSVEFVPAQTKSNPDQAAVFLTEYTTIAAVILLLAVNVLSLFDYLVSLRKNEFQVYLISGGSLKTIWKCALSEIMICFILSTIIGGALILLPFSRVLISENIWANFLCFFTGNAISFLGIVLLGFVIRMKLLRLEKKFLFSERGSK